MVSVSWNIKKYPIPERNFFGVSVFRNIRKTFFQENVRNSISQNIRNFLGVDFLFFYFLILGLNIPFPKNIRVPFFLNIRIAYSEKIQKIFSGQIFFIFSRLGLKSAPSSCILYYQLLIKTFSSHIVNELEKHKRLFCGKNLFLIFIE